MDRERDFNIVWIDDYEAMLGMELLKQYDAMIVPHLKRLYIYDGREHVPSGVRRYDCKLVVMHMEDNKHLDDVCKWLSTTEAKLTEKSLVIKILSDIILDLSRWLEEVEDYDDEDVYVRPNVHEEDQVTYLQRMEIEDPNRWIELIIKGEPSSSTPYTSS